MSAAEPVGVVIRVALDWTLDLLLEKDLVQLQADRSGQREREAVA